jgi:outer membrane protein assembly factor BamB
MMFLLVSLPIRRVASLTLAVAAALASQAAPGDWPHWRGANGQGSVSTGTFPERWSVDAVRWKVALPGKGTSTPIVSGDRIYLTSPSEGQDAVLAFGLDGKALWETRLGSLSDPKHRSLASSCNASPATDGTGIYVHFKSGNLAALEPDGTVRWKVNLTEKFGVEKLYWDSGTSPVVVGDVVLLSRLHDGDSWVAAFDRKTGEIRWREKRNFPTPAENNNGYATPVPFEHGGKSAVLIWGADHLTAHAVSDGHVLWTAGGFNPNATGYWPAIATPVIHRDVVVVPVGRDDRAGQASVFGVRLGGAGDVTESHRAWQRSDIGVFISAPVVAGDRAYLLRHRGEVVCLDPASGKTLWTGAFPKTTAPYYASPVVANGILYAAREDGVVFAARVGEKFEILSENPMGERIIATPVPAANRLLLRGDKHLFCVVGGRN